MRVIVSAAYGTLGDVAPLMGIAAALLQQGHTVTCVVDGFFRDAVPAGARAVTLGAAEEFAAALEDAEARWRKPQALVYQWLSRLKQHFQLLEQLLSEAPADTVFVGHALDLAVKLVEARAMSQRACCKPHQAQPASFVCVRRRRRAYRARRWCCSRGCCAPRTGMRTAAPHHVHCVTECDSAAPDASAQRNELPQRDAGAGVVPALA
jgi:UDP:flavonoid glycosyltransferase YjiC (YdhE family)